MFVNKDKRNYENEYVINSIKNDKDYRSGYTNCLDLYNNGDWCNQFIQTLYNEFEVVTIRNVKGMKDGFYIVDRNYTKFINSSFITKKTTKTFMKSLLKGKIYFINKDKSVDKYFVRYIKDNTIKFYTYDEFVDEFNPNQSKPSNNRCYQPHTKSPHIVKKHYRNQPYGSRDNPQYRRIEIKSFVKGGKKVG